MWHKIKSSWTDWRQKRKCELGICDTKLVAEYQDYMGCWKCTVTVEKCPVCKREVITKVADLDPKKMVQTKGRGKAKAKKAVEKVD